MSTNSATFKSIIEQNLSDPRIFAIQSFLSRLIERKKYDDDIPRYRIFDVVTESFVTSLDDFILKLNAQHIFANYYYYSAAMTGDRCHPISVALSNFVIKLDSNSDEDNIYTEMFGKPSDRIMFLLNYLSDSDTVLPLKIFEIKLINKFE